MFSGIRFILRDEVVIKNYFRKAMSLLIITVSIIAFNSIGVNAEWKQDNNGWCYEEGNSLATGWKLINGNWYYFYSNGYMAHDTIIDGYYLDSSGAWSANSNKNQITNQELIMMNNQTPFNSNDFVINDINLETIDNKHFTSILGEPTSIKVISGPPCNVTDYSYPNAKASFADNSSLYEIEFYDEKIKGPRNTSVGEDIYEVISKFKCDSDAIDHNRRFLYSKENNIQSQFAGWIEYENGKIKTVQYYTEYWNWHVVYDVKDDKVTKITMFRMNH